MEIRKNKSVNWKKNKLLMTMIGELTLDWNLLDFFFAPELCWWFCPCCWCGFGFWCCNCSCCCGFKFCLCFDFAFFLRFGLTLSVVLFWKFPRLLLLDLPFCLDVSATKFTCSYKFNSDWMSIIPVLIRWSITDERDTLLFFSTFYLLEVNKNTFIGIWFTWR